MKLINFLDFKPLENLRTEMKAPLVKPIFIHPFHSHSKPVKSDRIEIESLDALTIHPDGTLIFDNTRIILYITDNTLLHLNEVPIISEFHISSCPTIQELVTRGRRLRYFVTAADDEQFVVDDTNEVKKLTVCKDCLLFLNWSQFADVDQKRKKEIVATFTVSSFFKKYPRHL